MGSCIAPVTVEQETRPEQAGGLTGPDYPPPPSFTISLVESETREQMKEDRRWKEGRVIGRGTGSIRRNSYNGGGRRGGGATPQSQKKSHFNSVCFPHNVSVIVTII